MVNSDSLWRLIIVIFILSELQFIYLLILSSCVCLIVKISCLNFMNISIPKSLYNFRELRLFIYLYSHSILMSEQLFVHFVKLFDD